MKLSNKQKRFCDEYLVDLNATQAATRAGYSERTAREIGCENLTKPNIQAYISNKQKILAEKTEIKIEWIVAELRKTYERCSQKALVLDRDGSDLGIWKFDASGSIKCLELLGKYLGMFKQKIELSGEMHGAGKIIVYIPDNGRDHSG